ncbi:MAG: PEGA domain-containing protein [Planctomycetota bacterium]|jgi:hypothetical protein
MKKLLILILFCISAAGGFLIKEKIYPAPSISVKSTPVSSVYLNGRFKGTTPLIIRNLDKGVYHLKLSRENFEDISSKIDVAGSENVDLSLQEKKLSAVKVSSVPAGASVMMNGLYAGKTPLKISDLTAKNYHLELVMENYFSSSKTIELTGEKDEIVEIKLRHRQVSSYLDRIEQNRHDLAAYNDLGELLFRLGRYEESADIYVRGYVASSDSVSWNATQVKNRSYLLREARTKYKNAGFQKCHDKRVIAEVNKGTNASNLIDIYRKVPFRSYKKEYLAAWDSFVEKNQKDYNRLLVMAEAAIAMGENQRVILAVEKALAPNKTSLSFYLAVLRKIMPLAKIRNDKDVNKLLDRVMAQTEKLVGGRKNLQFMYEKARFTMGRKEHQKAFYIFKKVVSDQKNKNTRIQWALDTGKAYKGIREYKAASYFLNIVLGSKNKANRNFKYARKELSSIPKQYRKKPAVAEIYPKFDPVYIAKQKKIKEEARKKRLAEEEKKRKEEEERKKNMAKPEPIDKVIPKPKDAAKPESKNAAVPQKDDKPDKEQKPKEEKPPVPGDKAANPRCRAIRLLSRVSLLFFDNLLQIYSRRGAETQRELMTRYCRFRAEQVVISKT